MSEQESYLDYVQPQAAGGELTQLQQLAEQQALAQKNVVKAELALEKAKAELRDFAERQVPELMDQIGLTEFKTATGLSLKIDEIIRASITAKNSARAFLWLRDNGHAALIRRTLKIEFGKGEDESADGLFEELQEKGMRTEDKTAVNPQTLAAFVREKLREGEEIPLDLLGVHRQRVAKIVA